MENHQSKQETPLLEGQQNQQKSPVMEGQQSQKETPLLEGQQCQQETPLLEVQQCQQETPLLEAQQNQQKSPVMEGQQSQKETPLLEDQQSQQETSLMEGSQNGYMSHLDVQNELKFEQVQRKPNTLESDDLPYYSKSMLPEKHTGESRGNSLESLAHQPNNQHGNLFLTTKADRLRNEIIVDGASCLFSGSTTSLDVLRHDHHKVKVSEQEDVSVSEKCCAKERPCPGIQKLEPRDAWISAAMCTVIWAVIGLELGGFGVYYVEYTEFFQVTKAAAGWIKALQTIAGGLLGIVGSVFVKVYGCRRMAAIGGLGLFVGITTASFSPNIYMSYVTHGVIVGIGINMAATSISVIVQQHFRRNPVLGAGLTSLGLTVGTFVAPIMVSHFIETYGIRGTLMLHGALSAHAIPAALFLKSPKGNASPKGTAGRAENQGKIPIRKRLTTELTDFSLLRDPRFILLCTSAVMLWYNVSSFMSHLPGRAVYLGVPRHQAAYLQSALAISTLVGRIPSTFLANFKSVNKTMYYGSFFVCFIAANFCYGSITDPNLLVIAPVFFGIGMGCTVTVYMVVLVELFGIERLPRVIGLYNIASHTGLSMGPPLSGLIFDKTGSYEVPFLVSGALSAIATILIFVVATLHLRRRREHQMGEFEITIDT